MKNKNALLVLLVAGLVIALLAAIYVSKALPAYNAIIDTMISDIGGIFSHSEKADDGAGKKEITAQDKGESQTRKKLTDEYQITNNGYTLASTGKILWLYESTWPFVTEPVLHNGSVVTVTAEPVFITLSYDDGHLLGKQPCPVYPGETASFNGDMMTLSGRDGMEYQFRMENDLSFTDMRSAGDNERESAYFLSLFKPDDKTADFISSRLKAWSSDEERTLPELQLYTGHINKEGNGNFWAQKNNSENSMYVFTPDSQGVYQIGLANENGVWVTANAYVAVFGENGDLKQVSLDYVANKPIIKLHLSETEIYYIVTGWAKDMYDGTETWLQIAESR